MKDQDDGVKELKLEQGNRVFNHCFTGKLCAGLFGDTRAKEEVRIFVLSIHVQVQQW